MFAIFNFACSTVNEKFLYLKDKKDAMKRTGNVTFLV